MDDDEYSKVYKHVSIEQAEKAKQQAAIEKNNSLLIKNGAFREK